MWSFRKRKPEPEIPCQDAVIDEPEKTLTEYNTEQREQLLREVDLLKDSIIELCDGSRQCDGGFYVFEPHIDSAIFFIDSILTNLKQNYQKKATVNCDWCGEVFTGYFAKERESHHAYIAHYKENMQVMGAMIGALAEGIVKISAKDLAESFMSSPNEARFQGRNIK